jgi:hypothetical protein
MRGVLEPCELLAGRIKGQQVGFCQSAVGAVIEAPGQKVDGLSEAVILLVEGYAFLLRRNYIGVGRTP